MDGAQNANSARGRRAGSVPGLLLVLLSVLAIGSLRWRLAAHFQAVQLQSDDYLLPPTEQTVTASLGYRSALADLIYAHVLVSYGIHFQEKHNFEFVGSYLDTINALDPKFRDPYRFADTLLTLQPKEVGQASYVKARQILERGLRELPFDTELWSSAGQFMAYIAAPRFSDENLAAEWRLEGARKLARACELISNNENIPYHCINAATLLSEAGEQAASKKFLERIRLVNDDPEIQALASAALSRISSQEFNQELDERLKRVAAAWVKDLPFVTRTALFVLSPGTDPALCAGVSRSGDVACASSWRDRSEDQDRAIDATQ
ncbi:MAG TPA: hypothetical protein VGF76_01755 [Polyangiaceae bacterium]